MNNPPEIVSITETPTTNNKTTFIGLALFVFLALTLLVILGYSKFNKKEISKAEDPYVNSQIRNYKETIISPTQEISPTLSELDVNDELATPTPALTTYSKVSTANWKTLELEVDNKTSDFSWDHILIAKVPQEANMAVDESAPGQVSSATATISSPEFRINVFWGYEVEPQSYKDFIELGKHKQSNKDLYRITVNLYENNIWENIYTTEINIDKECPYYGGAIKSPCGLPIVEAFKYTKENDGNWFQMQCASGNLAICDEVAMNIEMTSTANDDVTTDY